MIRLKVIGLITLVSVVAEASTTTNNSSLASFSEELIGWNFDSGLYANAPHTSKHLGGWDTADHIADGADLLNALQAEGANLPGSAGASAVAGSIRFGATTNTFDKPTNSEKALVGMPDATSGFANYTLFGPLGEPNSTDSSFTRIVAPGAPSSIISFIGTNSVSGTRPTDIDYYVGPNALSINGSGSNLGATPYIYSSTNEEFVITVNVSDINFSTNTAKTATFRFMVWDQKRDKTAIGIQFKHTTWNNRIGAYVKYVSSSAAANKDTRVDWTTSVNETLSTSDENNYSLAVNRITGDVTLYKNGTAIWSEYAYMPAASVAGGMDGIDRIQTVFENFEAGDSVDIDELSINTIPEDVLDPVDVFYQVTSAGTNVFNTLNGYTPNTNGNLTFTTSSNLDLDDDGVTDPEVNWTNLAYAAGVAEEWSASTSSVEGTNATPISSIWSFTRKNNDVENNGMTFTSNGQGITDYLSKLWVSPNTGDWVTVENTSTKFVIDSVAQISSLSGNGRLTQNNDPSYVGNGSFLRIASNGSLTVDGGTPYSNLDWANGKVQIGTWGDTNGVNGGLYGMTVEVDGGSLIVGDDINVAHSKAAGNLNITTNGGSIVADEIKIGYDAAYRSTGTVNVAAGQLSAKSIYVGNASRGVLNLSGGEVSILTNGQFRIGYKRGGVSAGQHGIPGVGTIEMNGEGLVDISGGVLNVASSNSFVTVGYDDTTTNLTAAAAELRIRNTGTVNFTNYNKLIVGRYSDGVLSVSDSATLNVTGEPLSLGSGPSVGTLSMSGGTINVVDARFDVGGYYQGSAVVNMSGGTINANALVMQNSETGTTNQTVSTFNQTGGTVNTMGGEARLGIAGHAVYTVGGGSSLAKLVVNPVNSITNNAGQSLGKINLSHGAHNSTLNINSNGIVHVNSITLDSTNLSEDNVGGDQAVLNLNTGGTFIVEGNWADAIAAADGAEINISGGQILWRRGWMAASTNMNDLYNAGYLNLTGGTNGIPATGTEVFRQGDYALWAIPYHTTNGTVSIEADANASYTRFISVETSSIQSPYESWTAAYGVTGLATEDDDSDGMDNFLEYALNGDPTNASVKGQALQVTDQGANLFKFIHAKLANDSSVTYRLLDTTDLIFGSVSTNGYISQDESSALDDYITVTNTYDMSVKPAQFIELEIEGDE